MHRRSVCSFFTALFLLKLYCAAICFAHLKPWHVCRFDELNRYYDELSTAIPISSGGESVPSNETFVRKYRDKHLKFGYSVKDLHDTTKFCPDASSERTDIYGKRMRCTAENILTEAKKQHVMRIVRTAMRMHSYRLIPMQSNRNGFTVPPFTSKFCKRFTVPEKHQKQGVTGVDMMLYVSSFPSNIYNMYAAGAPCATLQNTIRPVAGAVTLATKHIALDFYSVRVVTHEIAHALGFVYEIMKKAPGMAMQENQHINGKKDVTVVGGLYLRLFIESQYQCYAKMQLEDEAGELYVPSRSHWERRIVVEDIMSGIVTTGLYTMLTMVAFRDMGFYEPDPNSEEFMRRGRNLGCNLFHKKCIEKDENRFPSMFCTDFEDDDKKTFFCAPGYRAMGRCSDILDYGPSIPEQYRYMKDEDGNYFAAHPHLLTDRCPIVEEAFDGSCTDASGASKAPGYRTHESWCLFENKPGAADEATDKGETCVKVTKDNRYQIYSQFSKDEPVKKCKSQGEHNFRVFNTVGEKYLCPSISNLQSREYRIE